MYQVEHITGRGGSGTEYTAPACAAMKTTGLCVNRDKLCETVNHPLNYYRQKKKYLPKIASAEIVAAYALTEPGHGCDSLSAETRAMLSEDGKHYILNGTKQFITNAGFADLFITYAQIDTLAAEYPFSLNTRRAASTNSSLRSSGFFLVLATPITGFLPATLRDYRLSG